MKYTAGPWKVDRNSRVHWAVNTEDGLHVAMVNVGSGFMLKDEPLANANLIAAAPDLLESIVWLYDTLASLKGEDWEMMKSAKAAVLKARGETPCQ